jgi:SAM-dependent methyltransferase
VASSVADRVEPAPETRSFARALLEIYSHTTLALMIRIGAETGLWDTLAAGPGTSEEIAGRAHLTERYVREWLSAVAAAGIVGYTPRGRIFSLDPDRAVCLTGDSPYNLAAGSRMALVGAPHSDAIVRAFRRGGGIPYSAYLPGFPRIMDELNRPRYDALLVRAYLPRARGLDARLRAGARVADVGCGAAHPMHLMARAYPRSTFLGIDPASAPLRLARIEARAWGLKNVRHEQRGVEGLAELGPFGAITIFDTIHDFADPLGTLRAIARALKPEGIFFAVEPRTSSRLEENLGNPGAAYLYGVGVSYCLPVSLAHGSVGLGAAWGVQRARRLFHEAGFRRVEARSAPANSLAVIYVARRR